MQRLREIGNAFRNFAIFLSFIVNIVLLVIVVVLVIGIFEIKNGVAEPLIDGLHENFVGLNEARIVTLFKSTMKFRSILSCPSSKKPTSCWQKM